jgi:hypothetical protein
VACNTVVKVSGHNKFRARLVEKGEPEVTINKLVKKHGFCLLFLGPGRPDRDLEDPNGIRAADTLLSAYTINKDHFEDSLDVLRGAWGPYVPREYRCGEFIKAIARMLKSQMDSRHTLPRIIKNLRHWDATDAISRAALTSHSGQRVKHLAWEMAQRAGIDTSLRPAQLRLVA